MNDQSGSAYLETLIALPVIFAAFVTLMTLGWMSTGHLVAQRAASAGARAAVVFLPDDPDYYKGDRASQEECVKEAVRRVLKLDVFFDIKNVKVDITGAKTMWEPTTVTVTAPFDCHALIGSNSFFSQMLCTNSRIATIKTQATLAYQAGGPLEKQ